ncbi:MAG: hypothetical protein ACXU86_08095 [Archangium sp.]
MRKLVPLLALTVTACAPDTVDRGLKDIPGLAIAVPFGSTNSGYESAQLEFDGGDSGSPCYRIPADTQLTANGDAFTLEMRGGTLKGNDGEYSCETPSFKGPLRPADEPRTEYVLSDGQSSPRAVFRNLRAPRSFRVKVNGQEQTTLLRGSTVDIEWLPTTDTLEDVVVTLTQEGDEDAYSFSPDNQNVDANHIHFLLLSPLTGNFTLTVIGRGHAGVEACDGFTVCNAEFIGKAQVPIVIE